jgi:hypothetical protein
MREIKLPIRLDRWVSWQVTAKKGRQSKYAWSQNEVYRVRLYRTSNGVGSGEMGTSHDETRHLRVDMNKRAL